MKMFERDHKAAFKNAIANGLNNPKDWMYMYSQDNKDFFKNIAMRNYVSFEFKNYISFEYETKEVAQMIKKINLIYRRLMFKFSKQDIKAVLKYDPLNLLQ